MGLYVASVCVFCCVIAESWRACLCRWPQPSSSLWPPWSWGNVGRCLPPVALAMTLWVHRWGIFCDSMFVVFIFTHQRATGKWWAPDGMQYLQKIWMKAYGQLQNLKVIMKAAVCAFVVWQICSRCESAYWWCRPNVCHCFGLIVSNCVLRALYRRVTLVLHSSWHSRG